MLRRIAAEHGLAHAEFRIGEHAGQVGLDRCAALYRELERLIGRIEHEMLRREPHNAAFIKIAGQPRPEGGSHSGPAAAPQESAAAPNRSSGPGDPCADA